MISAYVNKHFFFIVESKFAFFIQAINHGVLFTNQKIKHIRLSVLFSRLLFFFFFLLLEPFSLQSECDEWICDKVTKIESIDNFFHSPLSGVQFTFEKKKKKNGHFRQRGRCCRRGFCLRHRRRRHSLSPLRKKNGKSKFYSRMLVHS